MNSNIPMVLASFFSPIEIGATPSSLLWMFPLLLSIVIVYKATKLRVLFTGKFIKEVVVLFITISVVMILAGVGLNVLVAILTT